MKVLLRLYLCLIALWCTGCMEPVPKGSLEIRLLSMPYPRARCAKGAAVLGPLNSRGSPLVGVKVKLSPSDMTATTDEGGRVRWASLPAGEYELELLTAAYRQREIRLQVSGGGETVRVVQPQPCISGGGPYHRVGFNKLMAIKAQNVCGEDWADAEITWAQVEGPEVYQSVESWTGPKLLFRTRPLADVKELPEQRQLLSFSHDEAGEYVFEVSARNARGLIARDYVLVTSTNVAGGVNSVPPGDAFYFVGNKQGPWRWVADRWPEGWLITLEGADTRTPSVRLIPSAEIKIQPTLSIRNELPPYTRFSLVIGNWNMVNRDCGRSNCHATLQASWEKTRHAMTWQKMLDGELIAARAPVDESCATCHSLGYDPTVKNGGYDDVAALRGVTFPDPPAAGTYDALPEPVQEVSNVYCLACHGPARVDPPMTEQPGRFAVGVCARCHDQLPEQDLVAQWRTSKMSRTVQGDLNGPESKEECRHCHTAQGFYYENFALGRPPGTGVVVMTCCENLAPITCQTCHSPMYAENQAQIFRYGAVQTKSGLDLKEVGAGALCATCHHTNHDRADPGTLTERLAPHSPQADLSYGRAGFALDVDAARGLPALEGVACAREAGEGCVTCHMDKGPAAAEPGYRAVGDHTFRMISAEGVENVRPCQACHPGRQSFNPLAGADYDGDGSVEQVREEYEGLMALVKERLADAIWDRGYAGCDAQASRGTWFKAGYRLKVVVLDERGFDLGDCDRNGEIERREQPFLFPAEDLVLHKAAYNVLLLEADNSKGLHNYPYTIKMLQRTLIGLSGGINLPLMEILR